MRRNQKKASYHPSLELDNAGISAAFRTKYTAKNTSKSKFTLVSDDADKYEKGVRSAVEIFL